MDSWRVQFGKPSPGWRRFIILLPRAAKTEKWSRKSKRVFRYFMRRKGWVWLGTTVRRKMRNSSSWSQHSWPGQAHDFAPPTKRKGRTLKVKERQAIGDRVVAKARKKFRKVLFIWEQRGSASLHRSGSPMHVHVEMEPKKTGVPPK